MNRPFLFLLGLMGFVSSTTVAQEATLPSNATIIDIQDDWSGVLDIGVMRLTLVLHIKSDERDTVKASLDCLEQAVKEIPVDFIELKDKKIKFEIKNLAASYEGLLNPQGEEIVGKFTQNGASFPLVLRRGAVASPTVYHRPQEPKPPYPYKEEEINFENK